jgi:hypothetical protein
MEFVEARYVAMRNLVRQPQFVLESIENLGIGGNFRLQYLERQHLAGLAVPAL